MPVACVALVERTSMAGGAGPVSVSSRGRCRGRGRRGGGRGGEERCVSLGARVTARRGRVSAGPRECWHGRRPLVTGTLRSRDGSHDI